jgi:hypothetical protein
VALAAPFRLVDPHTHLIVDSISADGDIAMLKKLGRHLTSQFASRHARR